MYDNGSDITLWCDGIRESGNTGGEPPSKKRKTDGQARLLSQTQS